MMAALVQTHGPADVGPGTKLGPDEIMPALGLAAWAKFIELAKPA